MDPQQRLLLEVVYEALENAGITLQEIRGTMASVFCGSFTNDYNAMLTKDLEYYPKYTVRFALSSTLREPRTNTRIRSLELVMQFLATVFLTFTTFTAPA